MNPPDRYDAIASQLTSPGRSAVAVVGLMAENPVETLRQLFRPASSEPLLAGQVRFGRFLGDGSADHANSDQSSDDQSVGESVVVTPIDDRTLEIHCHGGVAAVAAILDGLEQRGVRVVDSDVWDRSTQSQLATEILQVARRCVTAKTAAIAFAQLRRIPEWCKVIRGQLSGEDGHFTDDPLHTVRSTAESTLRMANWSVRLATPFRVVLAGPPNVGKSTLMNAIVGYQRSITFDQAGTTRDVLDAETVLDGWPIRLSDTAGLRSIRDGSTADDRWALIEQQGMERAGQVLAGADLVVSVTAPPHAAMSDATIRSLTRSPVLQILNKADLMRADAAVSADSASNDAPGVVSPQSADGSTCLTVATQGVGIDNLCQLIVRRLIGDRVPADAIVPLTPRQLGWFEAIASAADADECLDAAAGLCSGDKIRTTD